MTSADPFQKDKNRLLYGTGQPHLEILKSAYRDETQVLKRFQEIFPREVEDLQRIFKGAKWTLTQEGQFFFNRAEGAKGPAELYSLAGTFSKKADRLEFQGEYNPSSGTTISLDGLIELEAEAVRVEVIYAISALALPKSPGFHSAFPKNR